MLVSFFTVGALPPKMGGTTAQRRRHIHTITARAAQHQRRRIDALTRYLAYATFMAILEADSAGWWSIHVAWTLRRLEACGYRFPEVAIPFEGEQWAA